MIKDLFFVFWFFSPAGVATVAALLAGKSSLLQRYSYPADFYLKIRKKRIFGEHKTIRGFIVGVITGIGTVYLQVFLYNNIGFLRKLLPLDYSLVDPIVLGSLFGFGAMFGDGIKSFFKRQIGIAPGKSWFPFDQIDYIVGGTLFSLLYIRLSVTQYVLLFIVWFLIHPITTFIGYLFRVKESPL